MTAATSSSFQRTVTSVATLTNLPVEITYRIWELLNPETLLFVGAVCRRWFHLSKDSFFWKTIMETHQSTWKSYTGSGSKNLLKKSKRGFSILIALGRSQSTTMAAPIGGATTDWRRCFAEQIVAQNKFMHRKRQMPQSFSASSHRDNRVYRIPT